jgi:outer membrane beta-barrel protein
MTTMRNWLSCFVIAAALVPATARAERRNPLEGQPSIRHRTELRDLRFELPPFVGITLLQDFNNTAYGGAKIHYHLNDWLAVGGLFGGGAAIDTGLKTRILRTLTPCTQGAPPQTGPLRCDASDAMNHIAWFAAAQAELTPFGGKVAMFSKAFLNYDFYLDGGAGLVGLSNGLKSQPASCSPGKMNTQPGCNQGTKIGPTVAAGVHMFLNDAMAMNLEYRAIVIKDNQAGLDVTRDRLVDDNDLSWSLKNLVTLGVAFYLPAAPTISR